MIMTDREKINLLLSLLRNVRNMIGPSLWDSSQTGREVNAVLEELDPDPKTGEEYFEKGINIRTGFKE